MSQFHKIKVAEKRRETGDTVSVAFEIPDDLKDRFSYTCGQYITIRADIDGEDVRRSYSLCSSPLDDDFRVAVKRVENGRMSNWLNDSIDAGSEVEVMAPMGSFTVKTDESNEKHYVAFAAGSGITPVISIIKTVLRNEPKSRFTLFYGNRSMGSIIFREELANLESNSNGRFKMYHILSREDRPDPILQGRITRDRAEELLNKYGGKEADDYFLCGPGAMIDDIQQLLKEQRVDESKIHYELFSTPVNKEEAPKQHKTTASAGPVDSHVTVIMDGDEVEFDLSSEGDVILDAAMDAGVDAPFSCKGAVCCTCKAKVLEGSVEMEMNYALSDEEVEEGYILTCQSHPKSEKVVVDYDVI